MKGSAHTYCNIMAICVGIFELSAIREYGLYPIPYASIFILCTGMICGAIEKK